MVDYVNAHPAYKIKNVLNLMAVTQSVGTIKKTKITNFLNNILFLLLMKK